MGGTVDGRPKTNARGERRCGVCDQWKPAGDYYPAGDGRLDCYCRPCRGAYNVELWRISWRTDPAFRERHRQRNRAYTRAMTMRQLQDRVWRVDQARTLIDRAKAQGCAQTRLAAALGTSQALVSGWRTGRVRISSRRLDDLRAVVQRLERAR